MGIYIGKIWFESFEFHFNKRKKGNQLRYNTENEYIEITRNIILNGKRIYYSNERNGYGHWIDKIYFSDDIWVVAVMIDIFENFKIITSFRLEGYPDFINYIQRRKIYMKATEVKNEHDYRRIVESIQRRVRS